MSSKVLPGSFLPAALQPLRGPSLPRAPGVLQVQCLLMPKPPETPCRSVNPCEGVLLEQACLGYFICRAQIRPCVGSVLAVAVAFVQHGVRRRLLGRQTAPLRCFSLVGLLQSL